MTFINLKKTVIKMWICVIALKTPPPAKKKKKLNFCVKIFAKYWFPTRLAFKKRLFFRYRHSVDLGKKNLWYLLGLHNTGMRKYFVAFLYFSTSIVHLSYPCIITRQKNKNFLFSKKIIIFVPNGSLVLHSTCWSRGVS